MGRKKTENRITDESLFHSTCAVDRRGTRYGKLVCIEPTEKRQSGSVVWRCKCDCGNEAFVSSKSLVTGKISSCGCIKREMMRARATDHTGMRYGKLVAIEPLENRQGGGVVWRCRCDCGNEVFVRGNFLVTGDRKSCGKCLPREKSRVMKKIETILKSGVSTTEILQSINRIQMEREEYHV